MIIFAKDAKGNIVHVDSVPQGDDCGCTCIDCGEPLIAIQGKTRLHHFRHKNEAHGSACKYNDSSESILHYYAKKIISEEKKVMSSPYFFHVSDNGEPVNVKNAELLEFETVEENKRLIIGDHEYIPDLFCKIKEGQEICIEVYYTNRVRGEKFNAIRDSKRYIFLEVDVHYQESIRKESDVEKYKDFLINSVDDRKWLYHPLIEEAKDNYYKELYRLNVEREKKIEVERKINVKEKEYDIKRRFVENEIKKNDKEKTLKSTNEFHEELFSQLNSAQCKAVVYNQGPALVIAGAGSGKTRVLTYKIAYLIQQGMKPWNILALTFTNKAAKEMKNRIGKLVGDEMARYLNMGTFHSIFARILRVEAAYIGYNSNFTIYDETDSRSLIKNIIKTLELDDKQYKPSIVHNRISMAKNHLITAENYALNNSTLKRDLETHTPAVSQIYALYQNRLKQANAMDFDDLLVNTYLLFQNNETIRNKYANERFEYVLVDEYQDTNYAQQAIVLQLVKEHQRVYVVGDDAQSIYAFRGANIDNILDFQSHFKNFKLFKLEQNYRSTQCIVLAANSLIQHNERQIKKDIYSENDEGEKVVYKPAYSDREEAMIVCNDILRIKRKEDCEYSDFAILYRTNAQSRTFEEEMRRKGIPYRIYGGLSFYQRKEIKDIIAYFRLVTNPDDEEAFRRIINYPTRGIGNTTIQKIQDCARRNNVSLWEIICNSQSYGLDVSKGTISKIEDFQNLISSFIAKMPITDAYELGKEIVKESGISADIYSSNDPEAVARQENLQEFMSGVQDFVISNREEGRESEVFLSDFLQEVALLTDLDSDDDGQSRVSLMTVHSAKGLEFPTVFIVGLEENIFPSQLSLNSKRELEEERRLLYVAITRAEKHCILTNAKSRFRYGRMEFDRPSRFLADIDPSLLQIEDNSVIASNDSYQGKTSSPEWNDYESNRSYTGSRLWGNEGRGQNSRMQNSRPVASQFRADPKPKITYPRQPEQFVDPLSKSFKQKIAVSGGNLRRVNDAINNGGRKHSSISAETDFHTSSIELKEGNIIEHQRFGIGTVVKIEGDGENTKAKVDFRNAGTKQLLLKFARYKIIG